MDPTPLSEDIAVYDAMRNRLETDALGKWVLIYNRQLIGTFDTFEVAAGKAVHDFGRGPYLIRQIGAPPVTMPASVMFHPIRA